jgi:hypothetical protein
VTKLRWCALVGGMLVVFAFSVASAYAFTEFRNKSAPGTSLGKNKGGQLFKTNAGAVECKTVTTTGAIVSTKETVAKQKIEYGGCIAFGFSAKVTPAEYEFNINGTATVANTSTIEVSGCTITIGPTSNSNLKEIGYANATEGTTKGIVVKTNIKAITYVSSGGACGESGKNGEYKGTSFVVGQGGIEVEVV